MILQGLRPVTKVDIPARTVHAFSPEEAEPGHLQALCLCTHLKVRLTSETLGQHFTCSRFGSI